MAARKKRRHDATGRTKGERYQIIRYDMARSEAFRSLSGSAVKVWIELRSRFNGRNNGTLALSMDEAARLLGIGKATAKRAFEELRDKGFIVMTKRGHWYGRQATEWRLTDQAHQGHPPTNDWRGWSKPKNVPRFRDGTYSDTDGSISELRNVLSFHSRTRQAQK